jgi:hypothetical protein
MQSAGACEIASAFLLLYSKAYITIMEYNIEKIMAYNSDRK